MARKERISKGKTMSPNYFVFCEKAEVKHWHEDDTLCIFALFS